MNAIGSTAAADGIGEHEEVCGNHAAACVLVGS